MFPPGVNVDYCLVNLFIIRFVLWVQSKVIDYLLGTWSMRPCQPSKLPGALL
jgi:hypothetical protein